MSSQISLIKLVCSHREKNNNQFYCFTLYSKLRVVTSHFELLKSKILNKIKNFEISNSKIVLQKSPVKNSECDVRKRNSVYVNSILSHRNYSFLSYTRKNIKREKIFPKSIFC